MRLMIVEDNSMMRNTIRRVVAGRKDVVMECGDGDEAVSAYDTFRPDWVVMDYEMPRVDGITATARIMATDPNAKVLVVSQHNDVDLWHAAEKAGAIKFVAKQNISEIKEFINHKTKGIL
jgi:DNA-binding NarL/FixJ family response regulator